MNAVLQFLIAGAVLVLSAFVAFYLFVAMLVVGACAFAYVAIRRWLRRQGIVNPPADQDSPSITIIEGQFETVEVKPEQVPPPKEPVP